MKLLIVKLSSLGDVIHTLAAVTDVKRAFPNAQIDWLVDSQFSEIPNLHPGVHQVFSVPLRELKKKIFCLFTWKKMQSLIHQLRQERYDVIIDAQGLLKSAIFSRMARGKSIGFDAKSIRESAASSCYHQSISVSRAQHAVTRLRILFAKALQYAVPDSAPDFGIRDNVLQSVTNSHGKTVVFLHGTTWHSKQYPKSYWKQLAAHFISRNINIKMTYGNESEKQFVLAFQKEMPIQIFKKNNVKEIAAEFILAQAVIGVDTGLSHLAAALGVPTIALYGSTSSQLTGVIGHRSLALGATFPCSPCLKRDCAYQGGSQEKPACYDTIAPERILKALSSLDVNGLGFSDANNAS